MIPVGYGDHGPNEVEIAKELFTVLQAERAFGELPEHTILRLTLFTTVGVVIGVGGLDNRFLCGSDTVPHSNRRWLDAKYFTARALRLRRYIESCVWDVVPDGACGHPVLDLSVWMQTEREWKELADEPEGLQVVDTEALG